MLLDPVLWLFVLSVGLLVVAFALTFYPAVKAFLEGQGYDVKAEVQGCDVVGTRGDEPPVIIELKLRASRSLPFLTKATGVPLLREAARAILGQKLTRTGLAKLEGNTV